MLTFVYKEKGVRLRPMFAVGDNLHNPAGPSHLLGSSAVLTPLHPPLHTTVILVQAAELLNITFLGLQRAMNVKKISSFY